MTADPAKTLDQAYRPSGTPPLREWPAMLVPILRAGYELAHARLRLRQLSARDVALRNRWAAEAAARTGVAPASPAYDLAARVAYFIPRVAKRLPWRSDCLVQAMAAQDWLASSGVAAEIVIGARSSADSRFEAHAWLRWTDFNVTGGDTGNFTVLLDPE